MVQRGTLLSSLIEVNMLTAATGASDDTGTVSSLLEKNVEMPTPGLDKNSKISPKVFKFPFVASWRQSPSNPTS